MKIALVSSFVPFIYGGGRNIVDWLKPQLESAGHDVEVIYLPFVDTPELLFPQLAAYRTIDLTDRADVVVCLRPPAHLVRHPRKVLWFIHHLRTYYDLWDTQYRSFPDTAVHRSRRDRLREIDTRALTEARHIYTNSAIVGERLRSFNGIDSTVMYPPVAQPERFFNAGYGDEIVYLARLEHHKRQHLAVEALAHTATPVRLRILGTASSAEYTRAVRQEARDLGVADRVNVDDRWITEEEKVSALSLALGVAYFPLDEDSYGYPSIEASLAHKPIVTTSDSGGVLELVTHGENGLVAAADPKSIAKAFDRLYRDRPAAAAMGATARTRLDDLGISWDSIVERIVS